MATRRFWPGRRGGTGRPPTPAGSPPGTDPSTPRGTLSSLPGVPSGPGTPEELRFAQVYAADRVGPMPYPNQASPDVGAARGRVRTLVQELLDGVDEGTGAALDPLIASWASGWLSRIDSQHADHQAVIDRLVGGARQQLAEAEAAHERDRRALAIARRDYDEARERLGEPVGAAAPTPAPRRTRSPADEPEVTPADPPTGPMPRPVSGEPLYGPPPRPERSDPVRPSRVDGSSAARRRPHGGDR